MGEDLDSRELPPKRGKGRPRRVDSILFSQSNRSGGFGAEVVPAGPGGDVVRVASFEVFESDDPSEVRRENGARLIQDAYRRAAAATLSRDGFDKMVYLALLAKDLTDLAKMKLPTSPGDVKARKRALEVLLTEVEDAKYQDVR